MSIFLQPDRQYNANGVMVKEYLITNHNPNRITMPSKRTKPLLGITIHNTGAIKASSGTTMAEQYTRATINGNMNSVRVHFYVDDKEAWQNLPLDWQGWHAADGNGDGNTATIAIECIGDSKEAEDNAARLTAWLLKKYSMNTAHVYTHTYWLNVRDGRGLQLSKDDRCVLKHSYKTCPIYIIPHWIDFIKAVNKYVGGTQTENLPKDEPIQDKPAVIQYAVSPDRNVITVYKYSTHKDKRVSTHFQVKEFADFNGRRANELYSDNVKIHNKLIYLLEQLFAELCCKYIIVNSGYRTVEHEKAIGNADGHGYHTSGRAADITCYGQDGKPIDAETVCIALEKLGANGIAYINERSVHVDTRSRSVKWFGDESRGISLKSIGYEHFIDYFAQFKKGV